LRQVLARLEILAEASGAADMLAALERLKLVVKATLDAD
jgi:hypothetical protein